MQNVILFIDTSEHDWSTSLKSGNSYMNRFSIEEDAAFEVIGIYYLEHQRPGRGPDYRKIGTEIKKCLQ